MSTKQIGITKVTFELLEDLLGFDKNTQIIDVLYGLEERKCNVILLKLKSPKCNLITHEGAKIPYYSLEDIQNGKAKK